GSGPRPGRDAARQRARQFPRHPGQHRQGHGDAGVARRPHQHAGDAAGELRPRDHGTVHDGRRRLHRGRRLRRRARVHRVEPSPARRRGRRLAALRVRLQRRAARDQSQDVQLPDLPRRQPHDSWPQRRAGHAGRPGFHRRARREPEHRALSRHQAVPVLRVRDGSGQQRLRRAGRLGLPAEPVRHEGGDADGADGTGVLGSERVLRPLFLAGGVRRPRAEGHRLGRLLGERRAGAAAEHGDDPLRAARRRRLGSGTAVVLDRRDAGADELRGEVDPRVALARHAPVPHDQRAQDGAARWRRRQRVGELPAGHRCLDGQRCPDPGEGVGARAPDGRISGVSTGMKVTRRQFIEGGVAAFTVTFAAPEFFVDVARAQGAHARNLVVLYLGGGNDSLSMLVPYNDPFYRVRRPTLAVPAGQVLQIGTDGSRVALGLHPRLTGLKQIFDQGKLALIQRTGYENQSRSHFLGTDIWSTADPNNPQALGWVGRYLDSLPSPVDALAGWNTTGTLPHVLQARTAVPSIANAAGYSFLSPNGGAEAAAERETALRIASHVPVDRPELAFVYESSRAALSTLDRVASVATYRPATAYPNNGFGQAMQAVAGAMVRAIWLCVVSVTT